MQQNSVRDIKPIFLLLKAEYLLNLVCVSAARPKQEMVVVTRNAIARNADMMAASVHEIRSCSRIAPLLTTVPMFFVMESATRYISV